MHAKLLVVGLVCALIAPIVYGAEGTLVVFDDSDENGFSRDSATCSHGSSLTTFTVHSGSAAVSVSRSSDNTGAGWQAPATYSTLSDYDGLTFWFNAGGSDTTLTSLAVYDDKNDGHFAHLEDDYGGPLPANMWIQFNIPFDSPLFAMASSTPATTMQAICVVNHSGPGSSPAFFFVDDVALIGADIFKNGFEP